jgi:hypothetical protein
MKKISGIIGAVKEVFSGKILFTSPSEDPEQDVILRQNFLDVITKDPQKFITPPNDGRNYKKLQKDIPFICEAIKANSGVLALIKDKVSYEEKQPTSEQNLPIFKDLLGDETFALEALARDPKGFLTPERWKWVNPGLYTNREFQRCLMECVMSEFQQHGGKNIELNEFIPVAMFQAAPSFFIDLLQRVSLLDKSQDGEHLFLCNRHIGLEVQSILRYGEFSRFGWPGTRDSKAGKEFQEFRNFLQKNKEIFIGILETFPSGRLADNAYTDIFSKQVDGEWIFDPKMVKEIINSKSDVDTYVKELLEMRNKQDGPFGKKDDERATRKQYCEFALKHIKNHHNVYLFLRNIGVFMGEFENSVEFHRQAYIKNPEVIKFMSAQTQIDVKEYVNKVHGKLQKGMFQDINKFDGENVENVTGSKPDVKLTFQ